MLLKFIGNMLCLFLWNGKKNLKATKAANLTLDQWNHGCRIIIQKSIQQIMNENPLLLKDWLELWRTTFFSTSPLRKAYTNKLANIVNYYNNIYDMTIEMKPADVK